MLAYLQMRRQRAVRAGELTGPLRLTRAQERELFRRMARGGLIARVRPGLYLIPPQLPLGGSWTPDEALALNTLLVVGDRDSARSPRRPSSSRPMPPSWLATATLLRTTTGPPPITIPEERRDPI